MSAAVGQEFYSISICIPSINSDLVDYYWLVIYGKYHHPPPHWSSYLTIRWHFVKIKTEAQEPENRGNICSEIYSNFLSIRSTSPVTHLLEISSMYDTHRIRNKNIAWQVVRKYFYNSTWLTHIQSTAHQAPPIILGCLSSHSLSVDDFAYSI